MLLNKINNRYGSYRGLIRTCIAEFKYRFGFYSQFQKIDWDQVRRLVFVCQGNICRSPYAHYLAQKKTGAVASFGYATTSNQKANTQALSVAAMRGVDLHLHRTTDLSEFEFLAGDLLLVMEDRHITKVMEQANIHHAQVTMLGLWARPAIGLIYDPHHLSDAYFHSCYQNIELALERVLFNFQAPNGRN